MPLPELNKDVLNQKTGGGMASLFGLPFFIAGLGVIVLALIPPETRGGDPLPLYIGIPFGSIFACVGGAILFGRQNLRIDRATGSIEKQWCLLSKPVYTKTRDLKAFDRISLRTEIRRSDKSTYTVYPIRLISETEANFDLSQSRNELEARKEAESLAKFLSLPIHDETSDSLRIRHPDSLDQSIKQKFESGAELNEIPEPPANLKSRIDYDGITLHVEVPPPGFNIGLVVAILVIALFEVAFISIFAIPFLSNFNWEDPASFIFPLFALIFLSIPTLIILALIGKAFIAKQFITVSNASLQVMKGWPFKRTRNISSQDLEELFIATNMPQSQDRKASAGFGSNLEIIAVSDAKRASFGAGLRKEELDYLLALTKGILVS